MAFSDLYYKNLVSAGYTPQQASNYALQVMQQEEDKKRREEQRRAIEKKLQQQSQTPTGAGAMGGAGGVALDFIPFGRVAEKVINPGAGNISAGEVALEAGLTALPFGLGKVAKAIKGGKAGITAARAATKADDLAKATRAGASKQTSKLKNIFKIDDDLAKAASPDDLALDKAVTKAQGTKGPVSASRTRGVGESLRVSSTVAREAGAGNIRVEKEIFDAMEAVGLKGDARSLYKGVDSKITSLNKSADEIIGGIKDRIPADELVAKLQKVASEMPELDTATGNAIKKLNSMSDEIIAKAGKDGMLGAKEIDELMRTFNKRAGKNIWRKLEGKLGAVPGEKELTNFSGWKAMREALGEKSPALLRVNTLQSKLLKAQGAMDRLSNKGIVGFGEKFRSASRAIRTPQDLLARGVQKAAKVPETLFGKRSGGLKQTLLEGPSGINPLQQAARVGAVQAGSAPFKSGVPETPQALTMENMESEFPDLFGEAPEIGSNLPGAPGVEFSATPGQTPMASNPLGASSSELFQEAYNLLGQGTTESRLAAGELLDMAKFAQEFEAEQGQGGEGFAFETASERQAYTELTNGLRMAEELENVVSGQPDIFDPLMGRVANVPILGDYTQTERKKVQAQVDKVRQVIGKAIEGGVLRKEDEEKYKKILPNISDAQEVAQFKISELVRTLQADIDNFLYIRQSFGGGGTTLEDLVPSTPSELQFSY